MRKLYLLSDEWNNDRNFVGRELELIRNYFDVTVICNDINNKENITFPDGIEFLFYRRNQGSSAVVKALFKCLFSAVTWKEFKLCIKKGFSLSKISETVRFYVNSELFWNYLTNNKIVDKDCDAIFYSYWYFYKCFALTNHRKNYPNINLLTRTHGYDLYTDQIPTGYQPFKKAMDSNLDKVVFIAEHGMEYYFDTFNIEKNSRHCLYRLGTKNDLGLSAKSEDGIFRIVSCSALIELKRVGLIIDALSLVKDMKIRWTHFGNGPLEQELKEKAAQKLSGMENIEYDFAGRVENSKLLEFYRDNPVDAFIMASRSEGNPVSVIEAMSFGIPIISTSITNMPNLVKENGILVSNNPDGREFADAFCKMAGLDSDTISHMRSSSRKMWEECFREEENNKRFVEEILLKLEK